MSIELLVNQLSHTHEDIFTEVAVGVSVMVGSDHALPKRMSFTTASAGLQGLAKGVRLACEAVHDDLGLLCAPVVGAAKYYSRAHLSGVGIPNAVTALKGGLNVFWYQLIFTTLVKHGAVTMSNAIILAPLVAEVSDEVVPVLFDESKSWLDVGVAGVSAGIPTGVKVTLSIYAFPFVSTASLTCGLAAPICAGIGIIAAGAAIGVAVDGVVDALAYHGKLLGDVFEDDML